MKEITGEYLKEIKRTIEEEFPEDIALQQVHIARKVVAKEAELRGLSFVEYIKSLRQDLKNDSRKVHP